MKGLPWLAERLFQIGVVVWVQGIVLRLTVRDSADLLAPIYYATPWPVIAALTLPLVWKFRRNPKAVFVGLFLTHVFIALWLMEGWRTGSVSHDPHDLRVVQWNVSRPVRNFAAVTKRLREMDADVIAVSEPLPQRRTGEPTRQTEVKRKEWPAAFPEYSAQISDGNMLILVRGEVRSQQTGGLKGGGAFALYQTRIKNKDVRVLQIDVGARPTRSRREPLAQIAEKVSELRDQPLIVLGDFNTPRDSVHFAPLRKELANTFEHAGFGSGETWPMPLPVLSLDQIWCGRGLVPVRCRHEVTWRSDHRPVIADLRLE